MLNRIRNQVVRSVHSWRGFRGNIDGFIDGSLIGWVAPQSKALAPLSVGAFTAQGGLLTRGSANIKRQDLRDAGIGDGSFGFALPLDAAMLDTLQDTGGKVQVRLLGPSKFHVGTYEFPDTAQSSILSEKPTPAISHEQDLTNLLLGDLQVLKRLLVLDTGLSAPAGPLPGYLPHAKLFGTRDYLGKSGTLPKGMTAFSEYVRYRYKLDQNFDTRQDPSEVPHFLNWYLAGYGPLRQGLRVPLSRGQIAEFNNLVIIGGKRESLTQATWSFLMGVSPILHSMDFDNPDWVIWAVYWWSINQAKALHCEDCLVPESYARLLRTVPDAWAGEAFAPSEFMLRIHRETPQLSVIKLAEESGRRKLFLSLAIMALRRPDFLRFIPDYTLKSLFLREKNGISPLLSFLEGLSGKTSQEINIEQYSRILRLQGFDLLAKKFLSITIDGHRLEAAMLPSVTSDDVVDIQIIGPFQKASGLGQATRLSARVLAHTPYTLNAVDFGLDNPAPEGFSRVADLADYKMARVNLIHLNAESIPLVFAYQPDVFSDAYNIGYFFWELDSPAACHHLGLDLLDEIWVSTDYGVATFQPHTDRPVINVGMCFEDVPDICRLGARAFVADKIGYSGDAFVFLVAFDSFSFVQRKNPIGVIRAFHEAFRNNTTVRLLIKTQNRTKVSDTVQLEIWKDVDALIAEDPRIMIIDETLGYDDLLKLKKGCDCYISLHKSEGWGFGMIEAMNLRVPVVCTGYSGNMDFCSNDTAFLVNYQEVELSEDDYIFVQKGQKWAEPDHTHAVRQFRAVYANTDLRASKVDAAWRNVRENFSAVAIAKRYEHRLNDILNQAKKG